MQTIHVSPEFPLNRRMRKAMQRGKLQVVRESGERAGMGVAAKLSASADLEKRRKFVRDLREIIGDPCEGMRPFVCDGFPLECKVFLVGYNPATSNPPNFWQFFNEDGFNKEMWLREYKAERKKLGCRQCVSPTRQRMEALIEKIQSSKCLEANLYPNPSASADDLPQEHKSTRILQFLLKQICPRVVVAYNDAQDSVCRLLEAGAPRASEIKHANIADGKNGESIVLIKGRPIWTWGIHPPVDDDKPHIQPLAKMVDALTQAPASRNRD